MPKRTCMHNTSQPTYKLVSTQTEVCVSDYALVCLYALSDVQAFRQGCLR